MGKGLITLFVMGLIIAPLVVAGCKGRVSSEAETTPIEATVPTEEVVITQAPVTEPSAAQTFSQETIPPTAAVPPSFETGKTGATDSLEHNKEIQTALKAAGFYTGNIDGKIGPKTKKAVIEFQKARGLKADGKVGPKTWAELDKTLKQ
jgi:peptidoglycan hydrolase-like protein with peptidoglycan-binding domain